MYTYEITIRFGTDGVSAQIKRGTIINRAASGEGYDNVFVLRSDCDQSLVPFLLFAPGIELVNNGNQLSSCICKTIQNFGISSASLFDIHTLDDAVFFEFAKYLDKDKLVHSAETVKDETEIRLVDLIEEKDNGSLSVIADQIECVEYG